MGHSLNLGLSLCFFQTTKHKLQFSHWNDILKYYIIFPGIILWCTHWEAKASCFLLKNLTGSPLHIIMKQNWRLIRSDSVESITSRREYQEDRGSCHIHVGIWTIQTLLWGTLSHLKCRAQRKLTHKGTEYSWVPKDRQWDKEQLHMVYFGP